MKIDFNRFRTNLIVNFNQVVENTDFSILSDVDLYDWHDLRHNIFNAFSYLFLNVNT